jgi:hypothetical protein
MHKPVRSLFERHWPVFAWNTGPEVQQINRQRTQLDQTLLTALLATDLIRLRLTTEEHVMRNLMYREPLGDVQVEFTELAEFRRDLGRHYLAIRDVDFYVESENLQ